MVGRRAVDLASGSEGVHYRHFGPNDIGVSLCGHVWTLQGEGDRERGKEREREKRLMNRLKCNAGTT